MNDTMGENGLVPIRLVFVILPRFPLLRTNLPTQKERMGATKTAHTEMNSIVAERRVFESLTINIPSVAYRTYKIGKEVLVFSYQKREWVGSFIFIRTEGRIFTNNNRSYITKNFQRVSSQSILP